MKVDIFKHVLFRIAGESFSIFDGNEIKYERVENNITSLISLEKQKDAITLEICDDLFALIKSMQDDIDRKSLINFKRDLFNGRPISESKLDNLIVLFPPNLSHKFTSFQCLSKEISCLNIEFNDNYHLAYYEDITLIEKICRKDSFLNGLLLSSELLYRVAKNFNINAGENESTIIGLWKYLTRFISKTTPFSTFTQLNIGSVVDTTHDPLEIQELSPRVYSQIRYNNYILEQLLLLLKKHPLFFKFLNICINPTLKEKDSDLLFFTNNNNIESFQTVKENGIIKYILNLIRNNKDVTVNEITKELLIILDSQYSIEDIEKYIFELTQTGLLYINLNLSGLDSEWDQSLKNFFSKYLSDDQMGVEIIDILEQLEENRKEYGINKCHDREKRLEKIDQLFNWLFNLLQPINVENIETNNGVSDIKYDFIKHIKNANSVFLHKLPSQYKSENIKNTIYEDSTKDMSVRLNKQYLDSIIANIDFLIKSFDGICSVNYDKSMYYDFFNETYSGLNGVSLLEFYERFYKDNYNAKYKESNKFNVIQKFINLRYNKVVEFIAKAHQHGQIIITDNECDISKVFGDDFFEIVNDVVKNKNRISYSAFIQFYLNGDNRNFNEFYGVINGGIMPGKGKMISRFLHLFPADIEEDLKLWNISKVNENELHAENTDASFFNANLHHCLMPYEILMPGGNNRLESNLINIADLIVRPNNTNKELELYDNDGNRVIIYDLCFQNPNHRSILYRLLCSFGDNTGYPFGTITNIFNNIISKKINYENKNIYISISPRITYFNVVLQRKQWSIPITLLLSIFKNKDADNNHFISVQKWRISHNIPTEVFIRLYHTQRHNNQPINVHDYKPQYMNFYSPISIKLFIKLINKTKEGNIVIEEMLPSSKDLFKINNLKYSTEALVQWQ